jgi:hypothetical protein
MKKTEKTNYPVRQLGNTTSSAVGVIPGDGTEVRKGSTYKQGGVGEERGSKETDGCPLTHILTNNCHMKYLRNTEVL